MVEVTAGSVTVEIMMLGGSCVVITDVAPNSVVVIVCPGCVIVLVIV